MNRVLAIVLAIIITACNSKTPHARIEIITEHYDAGRIGMNDTILARFNIKNPGPVPLVIDTVGTSCGCEISYYPKTEILKDEEAEIYIKFMPKEYGKFRKSVVIIANTDPPFSVLSLTGEVK